MVAANLQSHRDDLVLEVVLRSVVAVHVPAVESTVALVQAAAPVPAPEATGAVLAPTTVARGRVPVLTTPEVAPARAATPATGGDTGGAVSEGDSTIGARIISRVSRIRGVIREGEGVITIGIRDTTIGSTGDAVGGPTITSVEVVVGHVADSRGAATGIIGIGGTTGVALAIAADPTVVAGKGNSRRKR